MIELEVLDTSQYSWRRYDMTNQKSVLVIDVEKHESAAEESMKRFSSTDLLKTPKDKPFKCGECLYSTRKRNNLVAHMRTHSGVKPYSCDSCDFATTHKIYLRKHRTQCSPVIPMLSCNRAELRCDNSTTSTTSVARYYDLIEIDPPDNSQPKGKTIRSIQQDSNTHDEDIPVQFNSQSSKPFRCNMCSYSTIKMSRLKAHSHSHLRPYKCECGFTSSHKTEMERHRSNCTDDSFSAERRLIVSGGPSGKSIVMDEIDSPSASLTLIPKITACSVNQANNSVIRSDDFSIRQREIFTCDKCIFSSFSPETLEEHKSEHLVMVEKPFACTRCEYRSKTADTLYRHNKTVHLGDRGHHPCPYCDHISTTPGSLKHHLLYHSDEYKYRCEICDYKAKVKSDLSQHIRSRHTVDKPFKCTSCSYSSCSRAKLIMHLRKHTGEKPFKCKSCPKAYSLRRDLLEHKSSVHDGVRWPCDFCEQIYNTRRYYRYHIKKIHPEKWTREVYHVKTIPTL